MRIATWNVERLKHNKDKEKHMSGLPKKSYSIEICKNIINWHYLIKYILSK